MTDEHELLQRLQALDGSAFGVVYDAYHDALYRYIYQHVRHIETAQDLVADVFSQLLKQVSRGRGPRHHLRAWLYRVAHNLIVDDSRRQKLRNHLPLDDQVSGGIRVEGQAERSILAEQAREALDRLSPRQREVILLRYIEGLENSEIAHILNTSARNVRALQERGLRRMRSVLQWTEGVEEEAL